MRQRKKKQEAQNKDRDTTACMRHNKTTKSHDVTAERHSGIKEEEKGFKRDAWRQLLEVIHGHPSETVVDKTTLFLNVFHFAVPYSTSATGPHSFPVRK